MTKLASTAVKGISCGDLVVCTTTSTRVRARESRPSTRASAPTGAYKDHMGTMTTALVFGSSNTMSPTMNGILDIETQDY